MINLASFSMPGEDRLFRTRLEAAGIPAFVQDAQVIPMQWLCSNALYGVK